MQITAHDAGDVTILRLDGRFDAHHAPRLTHHLRSLTNVEPARIVVNLEQVYFIDSIGLAALAQGLIRCRQHNGDFRLCSLQQSVRVIFELTKLYKAFPLFETETEAIETAWQPAIAV